MDEYGKPAGDVGACSAAKLALTHTVLHNKVSTCGVWKLKFDATPTLLSVAVRARAHRICLCSPRLFVFRVDEPHLSIVLPLLGGRNAKWFIRGTHFGHNKRLNGTHGSDQVSDNERQPPPELCSWNNGGASIGHRVLVNLCPT